MQNSSASASSGGGGGSSREELLAWHNRTVRLLSERFGTKGRPTKKKQLPPQPAAAAAAAPDAAASQPCERDNCGAKRMATSGRAEETSAEPKAARPPTATLSAEELAVIKPVAVAEPRPPPANDEQIALDRIKRLLLEASDEQPPPPSADGRRAAAVRRYGDLFSTSWPAARKALDCISQMQGMDAFKEKLLLSVIVLCYKDCRARRAKMQDQVDEAVASLRKACTEPAGEDDMDQAFLFFLRTNADKYNHEPTVQEVVGRLAFALHEYPLGACEELLRFADACARVTWDLCTVCCAISSCPSVNCDDNEFSEARHVRKDGSDATSVKIASCIWPCLLDGKAETCLYKGIVVTS